MVGSPARAGGCASAGAMRAETVCARRLGYSCSNAAKNRQSLPPKRGIARPVPLAQVWLKDCRALAASSFAAMPCRSTNVDANDTAKKSVAAAIAASSARR